MSQSLATFSQLLATLLILGGYGLALTDWARAAPEELRPARRASRVWTAAALLLVLLLALPRGLAFGMADCWRFLTGEGRLLLLQALGLVFLVQGGQLWAASCGARPLRPERRRWRRWPWRWLAAALAGMLAWTLLLARFVPHHANPANLMHWLRLDEMQPWLQIPTAIALLTLAPILEECLFRHYLLYRIAAWLARGRPARPWIGNAIFLSSVLFAVGHVGQIDPLLLKWLQVFAPGLVLGVTAWRHGLEAAIALHWAFNICLLALWRLFPS